MGGESSQQHFRNRGSITEEALRTLFLKTKFILDDAPRRLYDEEILGNSSKKRESDDIEGFHLDGVEEKFHDEGFAEEEFEKQEAWARHDSGEELGGTFEHVVTGATDEYYRYGLEAVIEEDEDCDSEGEPYTILNDEDIIVQWWRDYWRSLVRGPPGQFCFYFCYYLLLFSSCAAFYRMFSWLRVAAAITLIVIYFSCREVCAMAEGIQSRREEWPVSSSSVTVTTETTTTIMDSANLHHPRVVAVL